LLGGNGRFRFPRVRTTRSDFVGQRGITACGRVSGRWLSSLLSSSTVEENPAGKNKNEQRTAVTESGVRKHF